MSEPSYPLTLPTSPAFTTSTWNLVRAVALTSSPFTLEQQVHEYQNAALWQTILTLPPMKRATAVNWQVFFTQLHGVKGTFLLPNPDAKSALGNETASPTVNGSHSIGAYDIALKGCSNSITVFAKGDFIQFNTGASAKLHIVVADCTSNASGNATVQIEPPLKAALANDNTITYSSPSAVMRMDDNVLGWDANKVSLYGISFSCTEAI